MFVRLFVDENLDRLVPISKQPKEKILAIIQSCNRQFPEFRDRARKRIRTYLKSCRRLKKLKEPLKRAADQMVCKSETRSGASSVHLEKSNLDFSNFISNPYVQPYLFLLGWSCVLGFILSCWRYILYLIPGFHSFLWKYQPVIVFDKNFFT